MHKSLIKPRGSLNFSEQKHKGDDDSFKPLDLDDSKASKSKIGKGSRTLQQVKSSEVASNHEN